MVSCLHANQPGNDGLLICKPTREYDGLFSRKPTREFGGLFTVYADQPENMMGCYPQTNQRYAGFFFNPLSNQEIMGCLPAI
jgi:hypothetical protein